MKLSFVAKDLTVCNPFISGEDDVIVETEELPKDGDMVLLMNPDNGEFSVTIHNDVAQVAKDTLIGVVERVHAFDSEAKRLMRLRIIGKDAI